MIALSFANRTGRHPRALAGTLALLVALTACGGQDSDDKPGSSAPSSPKSTPLTDAPTKPMKVPAAELRGGRAGVRSYLAEVSSTLAAPKSAGKSDGSSAMVGQAQAQLRNQASELAESGQHLEGQLRVIRAFVTRRSGAASLTVAACVDNSKVTVVTRSGRKLPKSSTARKPTLNLYELVRKNGRWVVTDQSFPADPDC